MDDGQLVSYVDLVHYQTGWPVELTNPLFATSSPITTTAKLVEAKVTSYVVMAALAPFISHALTHL